MAKQTEDREDLLRDGTAMSVRGRLLIDGTEVVIGFRSRGQLSLYWDQDPVFQFDEAGRLRRAFLDSNRLKVEKGRLVRIKKADEHDGPSASRLRLIVESLSEIEQSVILQSLSECLQQIDEALDPLALARREQELQTVGASEADFALRVRNWISQLESPVRLADDASA